MKRWLPALILLLMAAPAAASGVDWPDLADICVVKGRAANATDVQQHCAVFVAMSEGKAVGKPLKIKLPQYAYHRDAKTGAKTPVVLVQAENALGINMAGFLVVGSNTMMVDALASLQLLGTKRPR